MVAMQPKTIVITGASDGIGAAAARQLAVDGHNLVLVGRSPEKTHAVAERLHAQAIVADFAHLDEVRHLADELLELCPVIDVLANNAGLLSPAKRAVTDDGFELTNQVNYLAPFLLDHLLRDRLIASRATVIATSSMAHWAGHIDVDDLDHTDSYQNFATYGDSKLALLLHTRELQRRYGKDGLTAVAFHPGVVSSNFSAGSGTMIERVYAGPARALLPTTPTKGADTLVYLAEGTPGVDFPPGGYLIRRRPAATRAAAGDIRLADALWRHTEQALGL
ncbi:MAG: SDR family NAD(P)-dependent oxidoreductase, partial [Propionibacteriaceae bacterium]|nr:SDR family NAD(P)-dependent oxidoreductase [Propionibacteriaceae bacterium]